MNNSTRNLKMKKLLIATTALVATAGIASADITITGHAAGGFYTGTSIGTDTLCWQVYDVASGERLRLDASGNLKINSGNLVIGTNGKGIDFSAETTDAGGMESELLAEYETGTFTMTLGQVSASAFGVGRYVKIGRMVHFQWYSGGQINVDQGSGTATFAGLPFVTDDDSASYSTFSASHNTYCPTAVTGFLNINATTGVFTALNSTTAAVVTASTGRYLMLAGTYRSKV